MYNVMYYIILRYIGLSFSRRCFVDVLVKIHI